MMAKKNKSRSGAHNNNADKELLMKDDETCYGYIDKCLGNGRFNIKCDDNKQRLGILRGSMRNRVWIIVGDMVLCGKREYQDDKIDIVHKYTSEHVAQLYRSGDLPKALYDIYTSGTLAEADGGNDVVFGDEEIFEIDNV